MKTKLVKVISLLLAVAMLLSLAACKPNEKNKNEESSKSVAAQQDVVESANGSADSVKGGTNKEGTNKDTTTGDAEGKDSSKDVDNNVKGDEKGAAKDEASVEIGYDIGRYLIPATGTSTYGTTRTFTVDNSDTGIVYTDFQKFGCNVFPTMHTLYAQKQENGDNIAYIELNSKRFNDIKASYARSWFQIDWMMTNEAGKNYKKYKDNPENNPDYQNYMDGKYDFNNENMQSCIKYWRMLGEAGTEVEVSFGWKVAGRIQSWFSEDPSRPRISAPKDLDRYANAAKEMFLYCYDQGLTNINIISFYNEPQEVENSTWRESGDFATVGDKRVYWGQMARKVRAALDSDDRTKHVKIWGAETANSARNLVDSYLNPYLYQHYSNTIDVYTFHEYYEAYVGGNGCYNDFYDAAANARQFFGTATLAVTEFYAATKDSDEAGLQTYSWSGYGWSGSYASYLIALANNGWHTGLVWSFVDGFIGDPSYLLTGAAEYSPWSRPYDLESARKVRYTYYNIGLLNNYIPDNANVHDITYTGTDVRASAFTSKDGNDFSLLVEKNSDTGIIVSALKFKANLTKSLEGKTIYLYSFTYEDTTKDIQATLTKSYKTISNVTDSFSFSETSSEKGKYSVYIFTTIKPLEQVELYKSGTTEQAVVNELNVNDNSSISIAPQLINTNATEVQWEIKEYSVLPENKNTQKQIDKTEIENADLGEITQNGNTVTYTPAADAKNGDVVALRATIKGTNRYASAMIHIVK